MLLILSIITTTLFISSCFGDPTVGSLEKEASGKTASLYCQNGINAIAAIYGPVCSNNGERVDGSMQESCYGETTCLYTVDHNDIGDPCSGVGKDFFYAYTCRGDGNGVNVGSITGEASGDTLHIVCSGNREIKIAKAYYGLNCNPSDVTNSLSSACNGDTTCSYTVDHTVIGDPCVGTAKDYVYAYQCVGYGQAAHSGYFGFIDDELPQNNVIITNTIFVYGMYLLIGLLIINIIWFCYLSWNNNKKAAKRYKIVSMNSDAEI